MTDDGGRAPDPSDLGTDWVEALLGDAPARTSPKPPSPAPQAPPPDDLELGSAAMAEALLGSPAPPAAPAFPSGPPTADEGDRAPSEDSRVTFVPEPVEDLGGRSEDRATPAPTAPLGPPSVPPAPTWAGEHDDASSVWAPDAGDSGWAPVPPERSEDRPTATPATPVGNEAPASPNPQTNAGGWTLPALSASTVPVDGPPATLQPGPVPPEDDPIAHVPGSSSDDGLEVHGLPPLMAPRPTAPVEEPSTDGVPGGRERPGLPFLGIQPAPAPGAQAPQAPLAEATGPTAAGVPGGRHPNEAERPEERVLLDPSAPDGLAPAAVASAATGAGAASGTAPTGPGFLDLRPTTPVPPASSTKRSRAGSGGRRRRLAFAGVGAALLLVVGLVAYQLRADDDGSTDAVLTADAASIEAPDSDEVRGISLGVGGDDADADAVAVEEGKAEAAEGSSSEDGVVSAPGGADSSAGGSSSGGGAPATPGRLAVSASSLDFGGGTRETVSIRNEGGSSISWSASTSGAGYSLASASSGSLSPGQAVNLTVAFSPSGVAEGTATGSLTVAGGGSRSVSLRASVNRPPVVSGITWVSCGPTSRLRATVTDESGVSRVEVVGTSPAGPGFRKTAVSQGSGTYRADIGPFSSNGQITFFVEATDSRGNVARTPVQYRGWNNGC